MDTYAEHSSERGVARADADSAADRLVRREFDACLYSPTSSGEENFAGSRSEGEMRPPNQRAAVTFCRWKDGRSRIIVSPFLDPLPRSHELLPTRKLPSYLHPSRPVPPPARGRQSVRAQQ